MERRLIDLTLPTLAENLALDEALLLEAEETGQEVVRFWEWPTPAVVLGVSGRIDEEIDGEACRCDGVALQRRASGGGTVLLGRGCLLFSLVLQMKNDPALQDVHGSYRWIASRMGHALRSIAVVEQAGISDLAFEGMKVSGSAQQRKQSSILHHGTLLCGFDVAAMNRYLRMPARVPDYRKGRLHESFVKNLNAGAPELKQLIRDEFGAIPMSADLPTQRMQELISEKYGRDDWIRRR